MKKLLATLFCLSVIFMGTQNVFAAKTTKNTKTKSAATVTKTVSTDKKQPTKFDKKPQIPNLEEELNLTDEQKAKAKANRIKGRKEMKPIMEDIRNKKESVLDIMDSDLSKEEQQKQIKEIQSEIKKLHEKANDVRKKNMEDFEKILTKEQKTKFEKMKKEHNPNERCKACERRMPPPPMPQEEE